MVSEAAVVVELDAAGPLLRIGVAFLLCTAAEEIAITPVTSNTPTSPFAREANDKRVAPKILLTQLNLMSLQS